MPFVQYVTLRTEQCLPAKSGGERICDTHNWAWEEDHPVCNYFREDDNVDSVTIVWEGGIKDANV